VKFSGICGYIGNGGKDKLIGPSDPEFEGIYCEGEPTWEEAIEE
jgi:hypothetical protein